MKTLLVALTLTAGLGVAAPGIARAAEPAKADAPAKAEPAKKKGILH